VVQEANFLTTG